MTNYIGCMNYSNVVDSNETLPLLLTSVLTSSSESEVVTKVHEFMQGLEGLLLPQSIIRGDNK